MNSNRLRDEWQAQYNLDKKHITNHFSIQGELKKG